MRKVIGDDGEVMEYRWSELNLAAKARIAKEAIDFMIECTPVENDTDFEAALDSFIKRIWLFEEDRGDDYTGPASFYHDGTEESGITFFPADNYEIAE